MILRKGVSYWQNINKVKGATKKATHNLSFDEDGYIEMQSQISSSQYFASEIRDEYFEYGEEEYLRNKVSVGQNFEIEDYKITHLDSF